MRRIAVLTVALAILASACGEGDPSASEDRPTTAAAITAGIHAGVTELGTVLVDADGFTLYMFLADVPGTSACVDDCAAVWPPYGVERVGTPGEGVDAAILGEIARPDGARQATYNNKPLYRYATDAAPGDVAGQGINDIWFVIGLDGRAVGAPPPEDDYGSGYN